MHKYDSHGHGPGGHVSGMDDSDFIDLELPQSGSGLVLGFRWLTKSGTKFSQIKVGKTTST